MRENFYDSPFVRHILFVSCDFSSSMLSTTTIWKWENDMKMEKVPRANFFRVFLVWKNHFQGFVSLWGWSLADVATLKEYLRICQTVSFVLFVLNCFFKKLSGKYWITLNEKLFFLTNLQKIIPTFSRLIISLTYPAKHFKIKASSREIYFNI